MPKQDFKDYLNLFKDAFYDLKENHPVKFASAIAYFSLFALPSMFLMIVFVLSLVFDRAMVLQELKDQLSRVVGEDAANILMVITDNYWQQAAESPLSILGYTVVVFWLSTQLFRLFQNSLNQLWDIKPEFNHFWKRIWVERGLTFLLVLGSGLLFFVSVVVERVIGFVVSDIAGMDMDTAGVGMLVDVLSALMVFFWFALLYKVLPAVRLQWETTFVGAALTSLLFFIGIWLLGFFVVDRDLEDIYDIVAPIIVVGLWVFYSSLVFLYGASFTKEYSRLRGRNIEPASYAYKYKIVSASK